MRMMRDPDVSHKEGLNEMGFFISKVGRLRRRYNN